MSKQELRILMGPMAVGQNDVRTFRLNFGRQYRAVLGNGWCPCLADGDHWHWNIETAVACTRRALAIGGK